MPGSRRRFLLACLLLAVTSDAFADVRVENAWARLVPPVSEHSAAYMRLVNDGDAERRVVAAATDRFQRVEIHESVDRDGVARMEHRDAIVIPPGGTAVLAPGGYHLMLMRRAGEPLQEGEIVSLELELDDGSTLPVQVEVRRRGQDGHGGAAGRHGRGHR